MCIKKIMISLDSSLLDDIDNQAKRMSMSRSAFIRLLYFHYNDMSNITATYDIQIEDLKDEISRLKSLL